MSDPKTIPVEDITVLFSSGQERSWTLKPGDSYDHYDATGSGGGFYVIHQGGEFATVYMDHVALFTSRKRDMPIREPKPQSIWKDHPAGAVQ